MLLKPFPDEPESEVTVMPPGAEPNFLSVLQGVGLAETDEEPDPSNHIQSIFKKHGAGLENAARQIASILVSGDNDSTKLKAAETILKIHGVLGQTEDQGNAAPVFNITIIGKQNKNILNVLVPSL